MENMSDAIIMAGAIIIFVVALAVAMTVFSQARATIDTVLYASDSTNYYEYIGNEDGNGTTSRKVGWETVIPTLYKYYKENYTVVFLEENGNGMELYKTKTNPLNWSGNETQTSKDIPPIVNKYPGMNQGQKLNDIKICSFDVDEETKRHEPWTGNTMDYKKNLDAFLGGGTFISPSGNGETYNYGNGFIKKIGITPKFIETIGEYAIELKDSFASELNQGVRGIKNKRVIVYRLVS